jgi:hypothetical protein
MANTNFLDQLIAKALITLREQCIMPRMVNTDFKDTPSGIGDTISVTIPTAVATTDVTAAATQTQGADFVNAKAQVVLSQWKKNGYYFTDKERGELNDGQKLRQQDECIRSLANTVNAYILSMYKGFYGISGAAGTTPFASNDLTPAKVARRILNQQICPIAGRNIVLDPLAEANAAFLDNFVRASYRGDQGGILAGQIGEKVGFNWFMDQQVPTHTSTALTAGACTANGVNAISAGSTDGGRTGTISIAKATNTSPLVKGDVLTVTGDAQTYVVTADTTLAVGNTSVPIAPALKKATAGGEVIVLTATHTANLAFHPDAIAFASRRLASEVPSAQANSRVIADPVSGLVLRMEMVRQNKQDYVEFDILYGAVNARPEFGMRILG